MLNPVLNSFYKKRLRSILGSGGLSLFPYPTTNLVGHWTNKSFTQDDATAVDYSSNKNDATLKTGRGVSLDGIDDYLVLPDVGTAVKSITLLVRSATDTTVYATDDAAQSEDATAGIVADSTWQEVTITFATAISGAIRVATDGTNFSAVDLAFVRCFDTSNELADTFYLGDHPAGSVDGLFFVSGNGKVGSFVGGAAIDGLDSPVPQLAGTDWQEYVRFNGVDDFISVSGMTSSVDYFGTCNIEADLLVTSNTESQTVFCLGNFAYRLFILSSGEWRVNNTDTGVLVYPGLQHVEVSFDLSGNATALLVNGVSVWTGSAPGVIPGTFFYIGAQDVNTEFKGLIYNFSLSGSSVKNFAFKGYGPTPWKDTTGGNNDGVENGSPSRQLVSKHITNNTDALGNEIEVTRLTGTTFNTPPEGRIEVPFITAYDLMRTIMFWHYYDGQDGTIIDGNWHTISTAAGVLSSDMSSPTYYVNGVVSTSLTIGWNFIAITDNSQFGFDMEPSVVGSRVDKLSVYNDEKDSDTILRTYNKTYLKYFPVAPAVNDTWTHNGQTWTFNGEAWTT